MDTKSALRIAFYDSGIGGLPYFRKTAELLPWADYCYLADAAHFPLGEKAREEVLEILLMQTEKLVGLCSPQVIVIACNTASVVALGGLRERHPEIAFVGTVPAVKPAAQRSSTGKIAVVATSRAIADPYTGELVRQFASRLETYLVAAPEWVDFVERKWLDSTLEERVEAVRPVVDDLLRKGVDEIVLACTHFLFLEDAISVLAKGKAEVIDSAQGVSRRVFDLCRERFGKADSGVTGSKRLYSSGKDGSAAHAAMADKFGLVYGGALP